jgi:hypothetical protein
MLQAKKIKRVATNNYSMILIHFFMFYTDVAANSYDLKKVLSNTKRNGILF